MGINQTSELYKGFLFDGIDSKGFGVYITGSAVYNAPEREIEEIEIPGRNGSYMLDRGRFHNVTVTYPAGMYAKDGEDFADGIRRLRNALSSRRGYCKLIDEYNPLEYRMAVYKGGLDVDPTAVNGDNKAAQFDIVFDCKPQRFLKSGDFPHTIGGSVTNPQTKSGTVVSIDSDGGDKVTSLVATIEAVQAGSGDPSPTNVRAITGWTECNVNVAGKNLLRIVDRTQNQYGVFFESNNGIVSASGTATLTVNFYNEIIAPATGNYFFGGAPSGYNGKVDIYVWDLAANARAKKWDGTTNSVSDFGETMNNEVRLEKGKHYYVTCRVYKGATINGIFRPMLRLATETDATYEPYKGTTYPVSFGSAGTVYGGTVDVVTGVLTVNRLHAKWGEGVLANTAPNTITTLGNLTRFWLYVHSVKVFEALSVKCDRLKSIRSGGEYGDSTTTGIGSGSASSAPYCWIKLPTADVGTTASSIKAWLDANPIEITYPITPQTYQLTAQQVELLAGQNNVWADTGDISITYGHDPNKLVNPTLFESHPLLEVDGYGTISINGEDVVLHNDPVGRVQLGGGTSYKNIITYTFDQSQFNTGDFITVPDYRRMFQFDMVKPYGSGEIIDFQVTSMTAPDYIFSATKYQGTLTLLTDASIFSVGTARTDSYKVVGKISYKNSSGTASEADFRATAIVAYDGNGSITFTAAKFATDASFVYTTVAGNAPNFYGDSTWQPVTSTAYIDLDIGEAYVINDGAVIGINNVVDMPAKLPTLKPADNEITFDNTVTKLDIVPRWWEV